MAFNVTQCPVCESTFNTSARTLDTALGRVRCGACLTVFDAARHYIEQVDSDSGYLADESVFVGNNPEEFFDPSKFLTRSALTEIDEENDSDALEPGNEELIGTEELHVGFEHAKPFDNDLVEIGLGGTLNDQELNGESLTAKEIREEEPVETPANEKVAWGDQLVDTGNISISDLDQLQSDIPLEPDTEQIPTPTPEPLTPAQDNWGLEQQHEETDLPNREPMPAPTWEIIQESEETPANPITHEDDTLTGFEKAAPDIGEELDEDIADLPHTEEPVDDSTEAIRARVQESELEDEEALEALPQENLVSLDEMSSPLELPLSSKSGWGQGIAFSLLIILLGASLVAQYLWRGIEVYSQHAGIRPFYELSCKTLNCQVPAYSEIAAIRSDSLVVRSHPELANGLVINTTIRNTANFPQAFPIMVLSFNSASNDIVALRELAPAEYLNPGLQSFSTMPVMTPVQIDLEIIDPGPDAVNYTLAFRLP